MKDDAFAEFESRARVDGFDEVLSRDWTPGQIVPVHAHPFEARALVVAGEMWLTVGEATQHIVTGGTFHLDPDIRHSERYGAEGATYWVARRNVKPANVDS